MMIELLAKHSKLYVIEARHNMLVENNKVYIIPSSSSMTIKDGHLLLTDKIKGVHSHTINTFFKSLAKERGNKAIGVILSGTGSDGTEGIEAIKNAGGMVLVSDPESAEFNQMPLSAVASGNADHILTPAAMPLVIEAYVTAKIASAAEEISSEQEAKVLADIMDLIKEQLPVDFSEYKTTTILRRIKRRTSLLNFSNIDAYITLLRTDKHELETLC